MKVLYPIGSFYPSQSGGPNNTIYWITRELERRGVRATIVTTMEGIRPDHGVRAGRWQATDYGRVVYYRTRKNDLPFRALWESFRQLPRTDVLHLTSLFYPLSWGLALLNLVTYRRPVVWSPRGELDPPALAFSAGRKRWLLRLLRPLFGHRVTFHATCEAERTYVHDQFGAGTRTVLVPNYMALPERAVEPVGAYFFYIGRIHPKKAIDELLRALARSTAFRNSGFRMRIAGDAENAYGRELRSLAKDLGIAERVEFLGLVEGERKQRLLAGAYFSFMPSHTENFGNVVIEALAQGTPVVASTGTPWAELEQYGAGYWTPNDPETLCGVIERIFGLSETDYARLRERALALTAERYDVRSGIEQWLRIYQNQLPA